MTYSNDMVEAVAHERFEYTYFWYEVDANDVVELSWEVALEQDVEEDVEVQESLVGAGLSWGAAGVGETGCWREVLAFEGTTGCWREVGDWGRVSGWRSAASDDDDDCWTVSALNKIR